jgi:hypothetical protein
MADVTGNFVAAIAVFGVILVPVAVASLFMNAVRRPAPGALAT